MIMEMKKIYCVFHPTSAQICGLLILVVFTIWRCTENGSIHIGQVNLYFFNLGDDKACTIIGMRQIKIYMDDGGMRTLNDIRYILELRKNLIFLCTLQENGFSYMYDGDKNIIKFIKGELTVMRARRIASNIINYRGTSF